MTSEAAIQSVMTKYDQLPTLADPQIRATLVLAAEVAELREVLAMIRDEGLAIVLPPR